MTNEELPAKLTNNCQCLSKEQLEQEYYTRIRNKLEDIAAYYYGNGCIMFDTQICTPEEAEQLDDNGKGILDALARVLSESILC